MFKCNECSREFERKSSFVLHVKSHKTDIECLFCGKKVRGAGRKFCSKSCAAKVNNNKVIKRKKKIKGNCKNCSKELYENRVYCTQCWKEKKKNFIRQEKGQPRRRVEKEYSCIWCGSIVLSSYKRTFCSTVCKGEFKIQQRVEKVLESGVLHESFMKNLNRCKLILLKIRGHKCEICGRSEWDGVPIPLVYDHIDGDHKNGNIDNARLICGNCDMLLPTYKSKNNGHGRSWR